MAQVEVTGGGFLDSGDRKVIRKAFVSTTGAPINVPPSVDGFPLSTINATEEPGGIRRAIAEYSQGGEGGASYNVYGKRIELMGGTREVPIYNHPIFEALTKEQILSVQKAVEEKEDRSFTDETQQKLFGFLVRGTEYFLAPAIVGRVSEIESTLPSLTPIAKVADPSELNAPPKTFWVCTSITATPIGTRFEVTREYTLTFSGWEDVEALYGWS
jgi:hypothetical protein